MAMGGVALRFGQTAVRGIQLLASILCLGVFSYFLAVLADHHLPIAQKWRAVEGISGAAVLYGLFGVLLTLFLGGISFFAFLAVILDVCFIGCFAAIAVLTRHGAHRCKGIVQTPLGTGQSSSKAAGYGQGGFGFGKNDNVTYLPNLGRACKLEKAVFAVAIINMILFLISALLQVALARHHRKEKRYGPSPSNNYTSGAGKRPFWKRGNKHHDATRDAEIGTVGAGAGLVAEKHHHNDHHNGINNDHHNGLHNDQHNGIRPSHETGMTGSTATYDNGYGGQPAVPADNPYGHGNWSGGQFNTTSVAGNDGYTNTTHNHNHHSGNPNF